MLEERYWALKVRAERTGKPALFASGGHCWWGVDPRGRLIVVRLG